MLSVLQEVDLNKLFFLKIPSPTNENDKTDVGSPSSSGFRINYNFNTHQQREVEVIFVGDHRRFAQLNKGDIILQINGRNVDTISEKDLNKFVLNSNNSRPPTEFIINYLTIYRPFVEGQQQLDDQSNDDEDVSTSQQDYNEQHPQQQQSLSENLADKSSSKNSEAPISSSTPLRRNVNIVEQPQISATPTPPSSLFTTESYPIEEIKIIKQNGAMGLSIVGGGNVACHPFGVDHPGIFISKIVKDGPASRTNLKVGDRILKVNGTDVTQLSHDETVEELKKNMSQVILLVSHDPQPSGMQEVLLRRTYPEETLGIRINGGIENKSANIFDSTDEGIFVVNVINDTLAHRDGRLKVGTRIMEV
jgi:C-terminal processing protease CtpA/Prc